MENSTKMAKEIPSLSSDSSALISEEVRRITEIVIDQSICFIIAIMGIFTNIIVIGVFTKQGFRDTIGISMSVIALWDFFKCLAATVQRVSGIIYIWDPVLALSWTNMCLPATSYSICLSSYVTSVLAAYVAVERCLCVCIPFSVKKLLTPRLSCTVCTLISTVVFGCFAMIYDIFDIVWEFDPAFNATVATYKYSDFATNNTLLFTYYNLSGIVWPMVSLLIIVICTIIISYKLKEASKFRYNQHPPASVFGPGSSSTKHISRQERRVVKMLLVIIAIYIINLSPRVALYLVKYYIYELYFLRKYNNTFLVLSYIVYIFDMVNGSINLFIFLHMSTSFRETLFQLFHWCKPKHKITES